MSDIKNLFLLMEKLRLTKKQVSDGTGISTGNISDWAKGRCLPSADKLEKLADFLDCSVDYILGRTNAVNEKSEYADLYNKLDDLDQAEIRGEIKQMLKADKYKQNYSLPPLEADTNNELKKIAMKTPTQPQVKKKPKTT